MTLEPAHRARLFAKQVLVNSLTLQYESEIKARDKEILHSMLNRLDFSNPDYSLPKLTDEQIDAELFTEPNVSDFLRMMETNEISFGENAKRLLLFHIKEFKKSNSEEPLMSQGFVEAIKSLHELHNSYPEEIKLAFTGVQIRVSNPLMVDYLERQIAQTDIKGEKQSYNTILNSIREAPQKWESEFKEKIVDSDEDPNYANIVRLTREVLRWI